MTTAWRARFFEESDLFGPIREVAGRFAADETFPPPERIDEVLRDRAPVRFIRASQQDKALYDARIVNEREVSTREGSWHDFLNALVWATFPLAKIRTPSSRNACQAASSAGASSRHGGHQDAQKFTTTT